MSASARGLWVRLHRWAGLGIALFLLVAGLTGSILAFANEINGALNPRLRHVAVTGPRLDPFVLYEKAQAWAAPRARIDAVALDATPGAPASFLADATIDPSTGQRFAHAPREITLNPYTGESIHIRRLDEPLFPITRENFIDFVYALHYRLALPGHIGIWLFGIAALVWTFDCFVGAYLTLPVHRRAATTRWRSRWKPAWWVRWRGGAYKLNFDLHRAGGLWVWLMLLVLAWSSVGLNLGDQVYRPVMGALFDLRRTTDELPEPPRGSQTPALSFRGALGHARITAQAEAKTLGFKILQEREIAIDREHGLYRYAFRSSSDTGRYGSAFILLDAHTGALRAIELQDRQRLGVQISDWLFALHFGAVWGWPMQVFICLMGLVIAMLSATGIYLWWKKRRGRLTGMQAASTWRAAGRCGAE